MSGVPHPLLDDLAAAARDSSAGQRVLPYVPVPINAEVSALKVPGQLLGRAEPLVDMVLLEIKGPTGPQGYFFPPDIARQIGGFLTAKAREAASGLQVIGDTANDDNDEGLAP